MSKIKFSLLVAALALATALTISCSSSDDNSNDNNSVAVSSSSNGIGSSSSSLDIEKSSSSQNSDVSSSSVGHSSSSSSSKNTDSSSSSLGIEKSSSSISTNVSSSSTEPGEGLMYWGHIGDTGETFVEYMGWYIENGYIESSSITGAVKEIQFRAKTGYRMILIPQSAGVPSRIDDALGNNVKGIFTFKNNFVVKGMPYYLFIQDSGMTSDTGNGFRLTIKW